MNFSEVKEKIKKYKEQRIQLGELVDHVADTNIEQWVKANLTSTLDEEIDHVDEQLSELEMEYKIWKGE